MDTSAESLLEKHFLTQVFPILTPQALEPAHPFPFMPNQGLSVVFDLVRFPDKEPVRELVMIPPTLSRWVRIPGKPARYMAMHAILRRFSGLRFPAYQSVDRRPFRRLLDSATTIDEEAVDLVRYYSSRLSRHRRRRALLIGSTER